MITNARGESALLPCGFNYTLQTNSSEDPLVAALKKTVEDTQSTICRGGKVVTRDIAYAAAAAATLYPEELGAATALLETLFTFQTSDPNSKTGPFPDLGRFYWYNTDTSYASTDPNAIAFCGSALSALFSAHPELAKPYLPRIKLSLKALINEFTYDSHKTPYPVPLTYTNIYLMRAVDLILLGQLVPDNEAVSLGTNALRDWVSYTAKNGISEYNSPTYTFVASDSLVLAHLYVKEAATRELVTTSLNMFWTDIAGNFFPRKPTLSGPHSRDYDFFAAGPAMKEYDFREFGFTPAAVPMNPVGAEVVILLLNRLKKSYQPGSEIHDLAKTVPRVTKARWGTSKDSPDNEDKYHLGQDRYNFVSYSFSMGSSSADYGEQDKSVDIQLASQESDFTQIVVTASEADDPLGKHKNSVNKSVHIRSYPVNVQENGNLLSTFAIDSAKPSQSLTTSIVISRQKAEITIDGEPWKKVDGKRKLKTDSVVTVAAGDSQVSFRVFRIEGCEGDKPEMVLQGDSTNRGDVARIKISHWPKGPSSASGRACHPRVGVVFSASELKSAGESFSSPSSNIADLKKAIKAELWDGYEWQIDAVVHGTSLSLKRKIFQLASAESTLPEISTFQPEIESRQVNGAELIFPDAVYGCSSPSLRSLLGGFCP